jgi:hypothetical protein
MTSYNNIYLETRLLHNQILRNISKRMPDMLKYFYKMYEMTEFGIFKHYRFSLPLYTYTDLQNMEFSEKLVTSNEMYFDVLLQPRDII